MPRQTIDELVPAALKVARELELLARNARGVAETPLYERDPALERVQLAEIMLHHRRIRARMLPSLAGDDRRWELMLFLYMRDGTGGGTTTTDLATAAQIPAVWVRRHVAASVAEGLVLLVADRPRRRFALSPPLRLTIDTYLDLILAFLR